MVGLKLMNNFWASAIFFPQYVLSMYEVIHIPRGQPRGRGVDEMTMNDHKGGGEGTQNDHVVTWIEMYFASDQK